MIYLRERTLAMIEDALLRMLAFGELVDCIDFTVSLLADPTGAMQTVGLIHVSLKGPIIGHTIGHFDPVDPGSVSIQEFIDSRVRVCLENIRNTKAKQLSSTNGG